MMNGSDVERNACELVYNELVIKFFIAYRDGKVVFALIMKLADY